MLTDIAIRSKAHWGYSADFMAACRDELVVSASDITDLDRIYLVCESGNSVVGYVAFVRIDRSVWEVDALFVDPAHIGKGHGRKLMEHALAAVRKRRASRILIQSDPHAAAFYQSLGCISTGERESGSIPGRYLPMFEIQLDGEYAA